MGIERAADIHPAVQARFNAADVDGLVALYEPDAAMIGSDGERCDGLDAVRANWAGLLAMGATDMALTTVYCIEQGDVALLRNDYTVDFAGTPVSGSTAEVARRQPDGTWLYAIDHPFGSMPGGVMGAD
jgi:ketosteroid isomerase-like protein